MKKLEDIPKKQIFEVPEGYFEKLPGIIQSRVTQQREEKKWWLEYHYSLRLALPAIILLVVGIIWFSDTPKELNAENILASIQTEDLITYLSEGELTTEELLEHVALDAQDINTIEESVYEFELTDSELEEIFYEIEP
jgi:hypothetical protein